MERIDLKSQEIFNKAGRGMANVLNEPYLMMNQVCLEPGQNVPEHQANSNVTIHVIFGEGTFSVGQETITLGAGNLLRVPLHSVMGVRNEATGRLVFLVLKTPHPDALKA